MSTERGGYCKSFLAAGDLSSYQYYLMKVSADNTVNVCAATTDKPVGILQNKPTAAGQPAEVMVFGVSKCSADAALAYGNVLGTSDDGQGTPVTESAAATAYAVGTCLVGAGSGNAGQIAEVFIHAGNPHIALIKYT
jgi:hypothetical protein